MEQVKPKVSMRHLYLYTNLLIAEAKRQGKAVRIQWQDIATAAIGPDPKNPSGLLMTLPKMAAVGTNEDAILLRALISHEILCHGHHTDFSVVPAKGIGGELANVLEDPRGELLATKKFPGSKKVIREGIEILVDRKIFCGPKQGEVNPASILVGWLVTELRSELLQQDCLAQFAQEFRALAIEQFGSALTGKVKAIALAGARAPDTRTADDLARKIVELLKLAKEDPQGDGGENSQQGTEGAEQGQQPSSQQSQPSSGGSPIQGGQPGGQSDGAGFEPSHDDLVKSIDAVLNATKAELGEYGKSLEEVLCDSNEAIQKVKGGLGTSHNAELPEKPTPQTGGSIDNRQKLRAQARATAASLSLKMEELLEAHASAVRKNSDDGRIRANRVWRVPLGDTQVFRSKTRDDELNTCFYMLVDESSSMNTEFDQENSPHFHDNGKANGTSGLSKVFRRDAAGRVAVAAGEVLDSAGIPFGMATYYTEVTEWQAFGGDWSSTLQRYKPSGIGQTNTHLAVVWALRKFIDRPEDRKVLTVITDGDPGDKGVLEAALREAATFGVEVRFVLIGDYHLKDYQSLSAQYGVAMNTRELAKAVFSSLEVAIA